MSVKRMSAAIRVYSNKMLRTTRAPVRMWLPWPIQLGPMMLAPGSMRTLEPMYTGPSIVTWSQATEVFKPTQMPGRTCRPGMFISATSPRNTRCSTDQ